ncbi:MAG: hypothetical protein V4590_03660 [Bacteroidota bacterium]
MVDQSLLPDTIQSIQKYVEIESSPTYEELAEALTNVVMHLLLQDMEKLLNILYRIDVNEPKVKAAFAQNNPKLIAPTIAKLILERELQKAESRRKYRG